ncbi:single-stranded DNA-binding protein [Mycoplasmatota bacterium WC44]
MLNQVILVGRLISVPTISETEDGRTLATIEVEVKRNYKNSETGNYESDIIKCTLWEGIAESVVSNCGPNYTIGIKARLDTSKGDVEIVAEKITFINVGGNVDND